MHLAVGQEAERRRATSSTELAARSLKALRPIRASSLPIEYRGDRRPCPAGSPGTSCRVRRRSGRP
jgi:hypothetical protein